MSGIVSSFDHDLKMKIRRDIERLGSFKKKVPPQVNVASLGLNAEEVSSDTVNLERLQQRLKEYNSQLQFQEQEVKLSLNEEINRVIITVINKNTKEVVYEFPYKEIQQLIAQLQDITGVMLDQKV